MRRRLLKIVHDGVVLSMTGSEPGRTGDGRYMLHTMSFDVLAWPNNISSNELRTLLAQALRIAVTLECGRSAVVHGWVHGLEDGGRYTASITAKVLR